MRGRQGEAWNDEDVDGLRRMTAEQQSLQEIAKALERSVEATDGRAAKLKIATRSR
ncbi:hypothetical protein [Sphingomonas sp.]|uniref:hypothetical protein n=1 Tax=Sphingomonas sp. TaxID=28214 RepID=UPI003AFFC44A